MAKAQQYSLSQISSGENSQQFIRNESEEEKYSYQPQINPRSREMAEMQIMKQIQEQNKPRYVFDSLYQDYYVKRQETELKR